MNEEIKVVFIIPKNYRSVNECSEEMQLAFTTCEQHRGGGLQAQWVNESSWTNFTTLTKRDVFVLQDFEGEFYEKLKTTKCLIVGPRCLSCCLTEGVAIPSGPEPVYTVAMRGLVITASGLTKQKKDNIRKKVHWMGGLYNTVLTDDTTHLVSDTVLSDKYIKSIEKGIPVLSESWVEAVWKASLTLNINGASPDFSNHKLPVFANLQVTTSGISKRDKQMIMKLVNEHGGTFSGAFQSETTDIVVLTKDGVGSEKYKAALEYGKACVLPTWVKDSAASGFALPLAKYRVAGASTSSPLAEHRLPDMSLNFSRITNSRPPSNFVDESRAVDMSTMSGKMKLSQETSSKKIDTSIDKDVVAAFENFDMSSIKKAGPIFDGFCIWVTGLDGICRERAAACVSRGGGVRYDCPHERVTHCVAGNKHAACAALRALPGVPVLSATWLVKSVEAGRALDETDYLIDAKPTTPAKSSARKPRVEPASPMSKRNLQLLRRGPLDLPPPAEVEEQGQDDIVHHYLSQPMPEPSPRKEKSPEHPAPNATSQQPDVTEFTQEPTEEIEQIFRGVKIEVQNLDEEAICELSAEVAAAGGALAAAGAGGTHALVPLDFDPEELITSTAEPVTVFWVSIVSYLVAAAGAGGTHALVPLDFDPEELITSTAEPVTVFWVKDCLSQQELLPIQYYHRPVRLPAWRGHGPLQGVVASLSTYSGIERAFLDELAKLLGATTQLRFCRRNTANALASTHLICPTPTGDKYLGAVKWGLPAVSGSWLMECAKEGKRVSEEKHLVGDTKGAVKWGLPAVSGSWLMECAKEGKRVSEKEHLVGDTKAPSTEEKVAEQPTEPPTVKDPEPELSSAVKDKENEMLPPQGPVLRRGSIPSKEGTPKNKNLDPDAMSPASRYIEMARQGLLGCDSQETPKRVQHLKDDARQEGEVRTPPLDDALSTPNLIGLSPTTRRRIQAVKRGEMPSDHIKTPTDPFDKNPDTPDSAFGAALRPGTGRLSPDARKRLWKFVNDLPTKEQTPKEKHTPLSEIRNRFLAQFNADAPTPPSDHNVAPRKLLLQDEADTPPAKMPKLSADQSASGINNSDIEEKSASTASSALPPAVDAQLQRLSAALSNRLTPQRTRRRDSVPVPVPGPETEPGPESQPNTVGWDDTTPASDVQMQTPEPAVKKFMLSSNVDNREEIIEMIQHLGGEVCDSAELDPEATHLLCAAPGRSEKMLGSVAAGKWVLHPAYVVRSRTHGSFLPACDSAELDPEATHLLCAAPGRSEKMLGSVAAGKWVLHPAYVVRSRTHGSFLPVTLLYFNLIKACDSAELDPEATHLLCAAPGRSEKMLGSVAAGKWVLHAAYVVRSRTHGSFLPEEEYEWGNPQATCLPALTGAERTLARAAHRWRVARELKQPGPFAGVVAALHVPAPRRRLLERLLRAGGGRAPPVTPPYDSDDITVCFADVKRYPLTDRDTAWFISKRIPVCAPVLLSSYLTEETPPNAEEHCLPDFKPK